MIVWKQKPKTVMVIKKLGDELLEELQFVINYLSTVERLNVVVEPRVHQRLAEVGGAPEVFTYTPDQGRRLGEFIDFVVCLGGDGVLLHTAQLFKHNVPPIIAFHLGSLGFLSQHGYGSFCQDVSDVVHGNAPLEHCTVASDCDNALGVYVSLRMRLLCEVWRAGKCAAEQRYEVLNEVVVDRGSSSFLTNINVYENGNFLTCVQADGLMVATPTGSTAYSAAAGGSMVHPNVPAILFTPICPHSLNFRPIILPDYADLEMRVAENARAPAWVSFDGKYRQELQRGDVLRVRMSPNPVATVNRVNQTQDWVSSLDRCFGWSNRISQQPMND